MDGNPDVINKCLKGLDDWQKDLFLNTIKYQGEGFSENKRKMLLKALLDNGAKVVDTFAFRVKVIQETKTEIIDKIEKLYYSINKPFEFIVANNDGKKHLIKIPNAPYNRLVIEEDHFVKEMAIHGYDLDTFYKLLEENEKMPKEVLSEICRINDTSIEDFYNNPNEDSYLPNIVLFWDDIRKKVFRDDSTKKEINELLTKLENGERFIYKTVVESSSDYNSQCQHIFSVLDDTTYDDYLAMRNNKKTDDLIKEVDKLSIYSIISKYFGVKDNE